MPRPFKELRDLDKQFGATLIAVRELYTRAKELGVDDIERAAEIGHDALIDCKLARAGDDKSRVTVWIYVDKSKQVSDLGHLHVFASEEAADRWLAEIAEGVAVRVSGNRLTVLMAGCCRDVRALVRHFGLGLVPVEGEGEMIIPFGPSSDITRQRAPRWCRIPIHHVHGIQKDENYRAVFTLPVFRGRDRTNLGVPVDTEGSGAARLLR
jgi:hypothetical protein